MLRILLLSIFAIISGCGASTVRELEETAEHSITFSSKKPVEQIHRLVNRRLNECYDASMYNILDELSPSESQLSVLGDYGVYMTIKTTDDDSTSKTNIIYKFSAWTKNAKGVEQWVTGSSDNCAHYD